MGNVAYFVMGNVWLLTAVMLWLGRDQVRSEPVRFAFFGVGGLHSPFTYQMLIVLCVAIGLALVFRGRRGAKKAAKTD
jgi:hypothetical protein